MNEMIRRVTVVAPGEIRIDETPRPAPSNAEVLVRMLVTGVCGSDTHAAAGRHPFVALPYNPGHEVVGVIDALGPDVTAFEVGDRVTVEPTLPCWNCKMCRTDRSNLCENLQFFGCGWDQGGMADYFTVASTRLHRVPEQFTDLQAALIEPLSTPVHAVRLAGDLRGKAVAIVGAGTIGLLVLKAARHAGAARIIMTDPLPEKRRLALALGADDVVDAREDDVATRVRSVLGESADVVFDCVAIQSTIDQAIEIALKAGTVVVVGVPEASVTVPLPLIQDQQLRIQGSATYLPEDYRTAMEILASGTVSTDDFITATFRLDDAAEAFEAASAGHQVKVLVTR
ncbi:zinc-binding dehydrogenase [Pseudactinotalea sp. HY158]|uniref:zinc-dependent alcohol dehydrogenase n=1 Tax=Pseudactinotalea sp. HY158 TaxID=2654547 RepID=UPI001E500730|nr:alcohol dehydrogenase catalytic domain-containing protein [Pseudactinotalea sp. HY158]